MPFISKEHLLGSTTSGEPTKPKEEPKAKPAESTEAFDVVAPGFSQDRVNAIGAAFNVENPIATIRSRAAEEDIDESFDPEFNPVQKQIDERPDLEAFGDRFVDDKNEEEYNRTISRIEYEQEQLEILAKVPTLTRAAYLMGAAVLEPTTLIPIVGIVNKARAGARIAKGLAEGTALAGGAGALREAALQQTLETRSLEQSAMNIIAEATLGGLIGGTVAGLSNPALKAMKEIVRKAATGEEFKYTLNKQGNIQIQADSVSAARKLDEMENLALAHINESFAKGLGGPEFLRAPQLRAATSVSTSLRKVGEAIFKAPFILKKHTEGIASGPNAQNLISKRLVKMENTLKAIDESYLKYTGKSRVSAAFGRVGDKISSKEFSERMWKKLTDEDYIDDIAEINNGAKLLRKEMDDMLAELQEVGILPKEIDPTLARQYMTRIYDHNTLSTLSNQEEFLDVVADWVRVHKKDGTKREIAIDEDKSRFIAEDVLDKILGESDEQISMAGITENFASKGKFTKERKLLIPDNLIEKFLVTDSTRLFKNYMARASKLLETQKALNRAGFENIQDVIKEIKAEARLAKKGVTDPEEAINIQRRFEDAEKEAIMMYRSMTGQLRKPGKADRYVEALLNYQFVRLLGGVTISSIPEAVMLPFRIGFLKTLRNAYIPMMKSWKDARLSQEQLSDLLLGADMENNNILRALGNVDDVEKYGRAQNTYDRAQGFLTKGFIEASGIGPWTRGHLKIAYQATSADIIRTLKNGPQGLDIERLAAIGIGKKDYAKIVNAMERPVQELNGSFVLNPHLWKDKEALDLVLNAIQNQVEHVIIRPGAESLPYFVQQYIMAKPLFQFKSFMSAATGRITISGLQRRDAAALAGMMQLIAAGSISGAIHDKIAGRELSDDPVEMLLDGISRSGLSGLIGTTAMDIGLNRYNKKTRRFGGEHLASIAFGPSIGLLKDASNLANQLLDGKATNKDIKAATRLIPYNNLFYIKALTERAFGDKK